jgi:hypothetical protein
MPHRVERIAKQESSPFLRPEQIRRHWKTASLHPREQQSGAPGLVDPPLNFGGFKTRVDFGLDPHKVPMPL